MGKLSILGVTRVNTLIAILREREREEINEARKTFNESYVEKPYILNGVNIEDAVEKVKELVRQIIDAGYNPYGFDGIKNINITGLKAGIKNNEFKPIEDAIRKNYKSKEHKLWLCETLEEAKQIVGIE